MLNNPLLYTDPSGEEFISIGLAIAIGAFIAGATYTITALTTGMQFTWAGLGGAVLVGAASAAVTFGIGSAATNMFTVGQQFAKAAFQALAHGTFQGIMTEINGGSFISGFAAGALSSIASSAFSWDGNGATTKGLGWGSSVRDSTAGMIAFGTIAGGAGAALTGGNFWQGAVTGLVVSGLNHAMHSIEQKQSLDAFAKEKFGADYKTKYGVKSLKWGSQMKKGEVNGYSYDSKEMLIVGPKGAAGGITTPEGRVYISDIYKIYPNAFLEVTLGHELIHSYHHMKFGGNYNSSYSEFSAHQYSIDFSLKNSNIIDSSNLKFYQSEQARFKSDPKGQYNYHKIPGF